MTCTMYLYITNICQKVEITALKVYEVRGNRETKRQTLTILLHRGLKIERQLISSIQSPTVGAVMKTA